MSDTKIYRFKFSPNFSLAVEEFSRIHRFNKPKDFKDAWGTWKEENNELIHNELRVLRNKGYEGDIYQKIYKSARYYHKNKSNKEKKQKKRKDYVSINRNILTDMDNQISKYLKNQDSKPSGGFKDYMENIDNIILSREIMLLKNCGYETNEEILNKFKKTYKNRYFIQTKK